MFLKNAKSKLFISLLNSFTKLSNFISLKLINYPIKLNEINFFKSLLFIILNKLFFVINYKLISKKRALRDFPVSNKGNIFYQPLYIGEDKSNFYMRIYKDTRKNSITNDIDDLQNLSLEIIKGERKKNSCIFKNDDDSLIPIAGEKVSIIEQGQTNQYPIIINSPDKFNYFFCQKNKSVKVDSQREFIIGNPLFLKQNKETKNDLVILLFIDGLADYKILGFERLSQLMPNTSKFFEVGYEFKNNYANSEWTFPSFANIFTGLYTQKHGLFDAWSKKALPKDIDTIAEVFQKNGYLTFQSGGNRMINPSIGYARGFDRNIYQRNMDAMQTIENFIENQNTFSERSTFSFLKLLDLKGDLGYIKHISNSIENSKLEKEVISNPKIKSVFTKYDERLKSKYIHKVKALDVRLGLLYSFLNSLKDKKITLILCSDHGQSFLNNDSFLLSSQRTKVPLLYKSSSHNTKKMVYEYTENIDIYSTLLFDSDIKSDKDNVDSNLPEILGGRNKRNFSFSQSIYPNQTYKAAFRSEDNEIFLETNNKTNHNGFCLIGERNDYKLICNGETYNGNLPSNYEILLKSLFSK